MIKQVTFVIVALVAVCVFSPAAFAAKPVVEVSVDAERAAAKAEARLRKAAARANRAAAAAGVRINTGKSTAKSDRKKQAGTSLASARRDAIKRAIRKRLQGGNLVEGR